MKSKNGRNPRESVCFVCFVLLRGLLCECVEVQIQALSKCSYLPHIHTHLTRVGQQQGGWGDVVPHQSPPVFSKTGVCGVVCQGI